MSFDHGSGVRFHLEETVWLNNRADATEIVSLDLEPDVEVLEQDQLVNIKGYLVLTGRFRNTPEELDLENSSLQEQLKFQDLHVEQKEIDPIDFGRIEKRFPLDITVPSSKVENLDDVYISIDQFDYSLQNGNCLVIEADISLLGVEDGLKVDNTSRQQHPFGEQASAFGQSDRREPEEEVDEAASRKEDVNETDNRKEDVDETDSRKGEDSWQREEEAHAFQQTGFSFEVSASQADDKSTTRQAAGEEDHLVQPEKGPTESLEKGSTEPLFTEPLADVQASSRAEEQEQPTGQPPVDKGQEEADQKAAEAAAPSRLETTIRPKPETNGAEDQMEDQGESVGESVSAAETAAPEQEAQRPAEKVGSFISKLMSGKEEEPVKRTKLKMCIVQRHETLDQIAERYKVTADEIIRFNRLQTGQVNAGDVIYIPITAQQQ
ncbi:stage VI sporulation protein D [Caldalkalibacillus thermarum TA2.A1]|nr:LysM peptidoglycan-binding domain-containing protein [Caldalkalibacillus thermarum]EGL81579.1 stage VI sporulation protein D [Caldalkalibacillus thermarum TA2.A1]